MQFSLPDEDYEYRCAFDGRGMASVLEQLDSWLRSESKYGNHNADTLDAFLKCRQRLRELVADNGVELS
jgi:hypothetical protein